MTDNGTILVVDDTLASLKLLSDTLKAEGYVIRPAQSGELALRSAMLNPPELILLDIRMPGIDGFETCRQLKAQPQTRNVPVIFLSAMSEIDEKIQGFSLGAVDFVSKPFQREELLARVRTHLALFRLGSHLESVVDQRTQALRDSEARFRSLIEAIPQQVWTAQANGALDYMSISMSRYFGQDVGVSNKGGWHEFIHPDDMSLHQQSWENSLNSGQCYEIDFRLRRADGGYRWHVGTALPIKDTHGAVVKWFGTNTEISERKQAEQTLRQVNEDLEMRVEERTIELRQAMAQIVETQKLASLGVLVAGVSHELNTPLGNIVMMTSALSDRIGDFLDVAHEGKLTRGGLNFALTEWKNACDIVVRNAQRANGLIDSFKRVSVDQANQHRRKFDLRETLQDILITLAVMIRRAKITTEIHVPDGIEMDSFPGHLEQILSNLIVNSIRHGFDGMEGGCITISAKEKNGWVDLIYLDNGRGIAKEFQSRVFEPFYTTKLGQGGSGLGMSIVHNLTHAIFKGRVKLESEIGQGVHLTFSLPCVTPLT